MYRVTLYEHAGDQRGTVIHEPANFGNKINNGDLELSIEGLGISTFEFSINLNNPAYRKAEPIVNLVTVTDQSGQIFKGRIAQITNTMDGTGSFVEKILCEDQKAYLYDSTQRYVKPKIRSVKEFLELLLAEHNRQVEEYKRIYVGTVTVEDEEGTYRAIGYDATAEVIKNKLLDQLGGYLILRESNGKLLLDYLKEYGEVSQTPLQIARNLKSASRDIDISELATRVVPLGQDIDNSENTANISDGIREKTTIESVNNGKNYLEDQTLVSKFGVIQKTIEFPNITNKALLKQRGQEYLKNQRLMLVTWTAEVIELGLLDQRYEIIQLGNSYSVANQFLYEQEVLQVIEKKIDILNPQKIVLTIGSGKKTFSQYQLEYRGLRETVETVKSTANANNADVSTLKAQTLQLSEETAVLPMYGEKLAEQEQELIIQKSRNESFEELLSSQQQKLEKQDETINELLTIVKELQESR
ncbi:phage tail protein [Enterococcus sp. LJL51]|uniref:phage tail protein n=1 Tax=Enterococcus sp. LJL51 TaxID=3416656 RepID=UPI003CF7AEC8